MNGAKLLRLRSPIKSMVFVVFFIIRIIFRLLPIINGLDVSVSEKVSFFNIVQYNRIIYCAWRLALKPDNPQ